MSFGSFLIHTCRIERSYQTTTNAHGLGDKRGNVVSEDQRCRLVVKSERINRSELAEGMTITTYSLLLPSSVDIQDKDRITRIVLEDGTENPGSFVVEAILPRRGKTVRHISVELKRIK
jgi:hypothetical protein